MNGWASQLSHTLVTLGRDYGPFVDDELARIGSNMEAC